MKLRKILSKLKKLPGRVLASLAVTTLAASALAAPITAKLTAAPVLMEGDVKSLNVTAGETEYKDSTNAKTDEVVQVRLWHHNREMPTAEKANNTVVKFAVPNAQGKTQVITGTSSSDNGNTISDTTTVNLALERSRVEYIPGSAKFRYNKGAADGDTSCQTGINFPPERCYATVAVSDDVVSGGVNLDNYRGGPLTGCNAYHETVVIQVRVRTDVVTVNKYVRHVGEGADDWATSTTAAPGDDLEYLIRFQNKGNTELEDVMVGDNMPKYNTYVNGTTMLQNGAFPNGTEITNDNITKGGINVGDYMPGAAGYVWFKIKIDPVSAFEKCGTYDVRNVGVVRPKGMNEHYNTAQVLIKVECDEEPENPVYSCDLLKAELTGSRKYRFSVDTTAQGGASIKQYHFNFGDGSDELLTTNSVAEHTFPSEGSFKIVATVDFDVDNSIQSVSGESCTVTINTQIPPELPNTGAGDIIGIFVATTVAASLAHKFVWARRFQ